MARDRRTSTRGALAGLLLTLVVLACQPSRAAGTVVIASGADLESANPLTTTHPLARQVQRYALFVTLARYDSALRPVPYFARSWAWSEEGRRLTIQLHTELRWHDGTPTTARDVRFTLTAARAPETGYYRRADLQHVVAVTDPDDSTVVLDFDRAPPGFPTVLAELPIAPAHLLGTVPLAALRQHEFSFAPVGNGPFVFVQRKPGASWVFAANPAFPATMGGPPRIERFVVAVVDEPTTKFASLASGDVDLAGIAPAMADLAEADPSLDLVTYPVVFSNMLVFNAHRPLLSDARVRRAIAAAVDRARIVEVALHGHGLPSAAAIPSGHPWSVPALKATDPKQLLDSAGWRLQGAGRQRDGVPLRLTLMSVGSGDNAVEQLVQADLRAVGIELELRQMELGSFLALARSREKSFDLLLTGIPGDVSLSHLVSMFDSTQAGGALDYADYHRPALDSALRRASSAASDSAARHDWAQVERILADSAPVAWLYHSRGVQGKARRLRGVQIDLRGELATLAQWTLDPRMDR